MSINASILAVLYLMSGPFVTSSVSLKSSVSVKSALSVISGVSEISFVGFILLHPVKIKKSKKCVWKTLD